MAVFYVFHSNALQKRQYTLSSGSRIPGAEAPFTLFDFTTGRDTAIAWTDIKLIDAYNTLCALSLRELGLCPRVTGGFRRALSEIPLCQSPRCAGLLLCIGRGLCVTELELLRRLCVKSGLFSYITPAYETPCHINAYVDVAKPASLFRGYPEMRLGSVGAHVAALQDRLLALELSDSQPDGFFSVKTCRAVERLQASFGFAQTGTVDAEILKML